MLQLNMHDSPERMQENSISKIKKSFFMVVMFSTEEIASISILAVLDVAAIALNTILIVAIRTR